MRALVLVAAGLAFLCFQGAEVECWPMASGNDTNKVACPHGQLVVSASADDRPLEKQSVYPTCAAFSQDNRFVLVGFHGSSTGHPPHPPRTRLADCAVVWEVATGKQVQILRGHVGGVSLVGFLGDGKRALTGGHDGCYRIWDVATGDEITQVKVFTSGFRGALSAAGDRLLAYEGRRLELWNINERKRISVSELPLDISSVTISSKGSLAWISAHSFHLWDVDKARSLEEFKLTMTGPSFTKQGRLFLVQKGLGGPGSFAPDGAAVLTEHADDKLRLAVWDWDKRKVLRTVGDDDLWPLNVCIRSDARIVCRSLEGRLVCWGDDSKQVWTTESKDLKSLRVWAFSNDGSVAISANHAVLHYGPKPARDVFRDSEVALGLWNLEKGVFIRKLIPSGAPR